MFMVNVGKYTIHGCYGIVLQKLLLYLEDGIPGLVSVVNNHGDRKWLEGVPQPDP